MSEQLKNIEEFFRNSFDDLTEMPSDKVLRNLKRKLWLSDFFSLRMKKFNVIYIFLLFSVAGSAFIFNSNRNTSANNVEVEKTGNPEPTYSPDKDALAAKESSSNASSSSGTTSSSANKALFEVAATRGCAPLKLHFKNKSKSPGHFQYVWNFGTGQISNSESPVYVFEKPGLYIVTLTMISEGKQYKYYQNIEVLAKPKAEFEIDLANSDIDSKTVKFINKSEHGTSYSWSFGDFGTSQEKEASHTYEKYKVYPVTLVAKSENGCSDTSFALNKFLAEDFSLVFPLSFRPNTVEKNNNGNYSVARNEPFIFYPKNNGTSSYELKIYAPNNIEIFSTNNINIGWNGYIKGKIAPEGIYTYAAKGIYPNGQAFDIKGTFNVIVEDFQSLY